VSYALVWTAAIHAGLAGSDTVNRAYQALALLLTMVALAATVLRILSPSRGPRSTRAAPPSEARSAPVEAAGELQMR
jgi:hypothetical protein